MNAARRKYTDTTIKILFGKNNGRCAYPDCSELLIQPATEHSDDIVLAQICHIYALSPGGPRGNQGVEPGELNKHSNLILLCPNHHRLIDSQHEEYPPELLKKWKKDNESSILESQLNRVVERIPKDEFLHNRFPKELVDQQINDEVVILRKSRFFADFDRIQSSLRLGRRILEGELSGGSDSVRSRALAWCARLLSQTDEISVAENYLNEAKLLGVFPEVKFAEAFITSQKDDMAAGLKILANIDSAASRTAALSIVAHHSGPQGALDWLHEAKISANELDADGKHLLLSCQIELAQWESACEVLRSVTELDLEGTPALHGLIGLTQLVSTVPVELRALVISQVPFNAGIFDLGLSKKEVKARRKAMENFNAVSKVARGLNCQKTASRYEEYALWLELRDPERFVNGRQRLLEKLRNLKFALQMVPLGFQFGINLDTARVENEIDRQISLNGGSTRETACARLALAFNKEDPDDVLNYITQHQGELNVYINDKAIGFLKVELLARAGRPESAKEVLESLLEKELSEAEEGRLHRVISEAEGADPIEVRRAQYIRTEELQDLVSLVDALVESQEWEGLCEFAEKLFETNQSVANAERLATALSETHKTQKVIKFLRANSDLITQSKYLHMLLAFALFNEGALVESRSELNVIGDHSEDPNYRKLHVNLEISLGNWGSLTAHVAREHQEREKRSAMELLESAQLALQVGSILARDLLYAAVEKSPENADVLARAYFLAINAGWDGDTHVHEWLNQAAALSGEDGPLQRMSLEQIFESKPEWDRHETKVRRMYANGEVPMYLASQSLRKSLIELSLFPAYVNLGEQDSRRKSIIPAYSGKRPTAPFNIEEITVGIDINSLLTLGFLDILDKVFDTFKEIWIPHSTLVVLFQESQKSKFHQPNKVKTAQQLLNLIATDDLGKYVPSSAITLGDLTAQVGEELASFIREAELDNEDLTPQRIVVRPSPVYRIASLMEEEADLTAHASVLSSCLAVVEKLRQKGQLTTEEENGARAYLQLNEKPWPNQPEISDNAILYLDGLAVTHFLHLGILGKLKAAGFKSFIFFGEVEEAKVYVRFENTSENVTETVERIRAAVSARIESGLINVAGRQMTANAEDAASPESSIMEMLSLVSKCDAVLLDDRFMNQRPVIDDGSVTVPIYSTLDILESLVTTGRISIDEHLELRTLLRRAGYAFIPISEEELANHLNASKVVNDLVLETAELKVIRESILRIRMGDWLQLPDEALWLDSMFEVFTRVLKRLWENDTDMAPVIARSNWIIDQIDFRGWAHRLGSENGDNAVYNGRGAYILTFLMPPQACSQKVKYAYWEWAEECILAPIKEQYPDLYLWILEWYKDMVLEMVDKYFLEDGAT